MGLRVIEGRKPHMHPGHDGNRPDIRPSPDNGPPYPKRLQFETDTTTIPGNLVTAALILLARIVHLTVQDRTIIRFN